MTKLYLILDSIRTSFYIDLHLISVHINVLVRVTLLMGSVRNKSR